ncbi:hypothetical protein BLS_004673 [Venturia inaequalis]|uniref:Major facilitator superfamily (MFS) profile domain-containing protein n=1 Tax=Venturia inaequalis TaxID=5025 RepID=A0A8H3YRL4_VENIN|nr:hypothetical protein BLS_004673 [Venturia inaequalis]
MALKKKGGPPGQGGPPPGMGGPPGRRGPKDPNVVEWDGPDDPENPMNFPRWKKWMITVVMGLMTFCITFASSVFSTATEELFGRKIPLFIGFFIFAVFQIPVAMAQNVQTIMLCRFFGGLFGSAPLGIVGGAMVDFWEPLDRGIAICIFSAATFLGPVAGPIAGGFITMSSLTWRWTEWLTMIMGFSFGLLGLFTIPETFAPVLLSRKAKKMRYETLNWALHARSDEQQVVPKDLVTKFLFKPFKMLLLDPILLLITLYMSLIYGVLYLLFVAYPIAFSEIRGWNLGVGALPFAAVTVGVLLGGLLIVFHSKTRYTRLLKENGSVVPEERLVPMMVGGIIFPAGLFWFAWTSSAHITWIPQVLSGIFIGCGVLLIFLQGLSYIVDCYKWNSASAIAGNTFCRSLVGAGFPLFATTMFHTLGVNWAASLLGFLAAALAPVPFLFFVYGQKIRNLSKFSPTGGPPGGMGGPPGGPPGGMGGPPGGPPGGMGGPPGGMGGPPSGMGGPPGGMGGPPGGKGGPPGDAGLECADTWEHLRTTACLTSSAITEAVQNHHSLHEAALNSLLSASLRILANMVSVQPSRHSPDEIDVVITFRTQSSDIVFLSADVSNWTPQQMSLYKFRIGENNWFHDGTVSAEPDGFFGWNNKFEIPEVPLPTPANDLDEDVDLESVAAVESIADTVSEFGTEGDTHSLFHDEDLIDRDEVIEDPDYAEAKKAEEKSPPLQPTQEPTPKPTQHNESTVSGAHGAAEAGAGAAETPIKPSRLSVYICLPCALSLLLLRFVL